MKANKKTLILLGTAITVMLVLGGSYIFLFLALKSKTEATSVLTEKIEELSGREARIASSVSVLRRESANIEKVSEYFFKESEVVPFAKKIEALGGQSGTELTILSLDQGYTEKTVPFLNLRIRATGKFSDISRLLFLLENFPGKLEWKTVQLAKESVAPASATPGVPDIAPITRTSQWRAEVFLVALNFTN